jgi:signal transduction histidine kinase
MTACRADETSNMSFQLKLIKSQNPLVRNVVYAHWVLLGSALVLESLARTFAPGDKLRIDACLILLGMLSMLSIYWPEEKPISQRLVLILFEILLITLASAIGLSRWTWPLYLSLVARAAVLLQGRYLWPIVALAFVSQESWYLYKWLLGKPFPEWRVSLLSGLVAAFILSATSGTLMVVVSWLMQALLTEQTLRKETQRLSKENQQLAAQLERTRIAREIHDTLGHSLTSLKIQLELSKRLMDIDSVRALEALDQAEQMAARSLTDTRVALQSVRNADFDLAVAVQQLVSEAESAGKINIQSTVEAFDLPNAVSYQLYRVVQESITNTLKHAQASDIVICLSSNNGQTVLEITDNGLGFDGANTSDGFGMQGMKERIASINGNIQVHSQPQQGTKVKVIIPMSKEELPEVSTGGSSA